MRILDGRESFYQWDLNQKLTSKWLQVGDEIHITNSRQSTAPVLKAYELDGEVVVDVPNILLQQTYPISVYRYIKKDNSEYTKEEFTFEVKQKPKPNDYVYTETEVLTYHTLDERITEIEQNGTTVPEWAKQPEKPTYTAKEVGALSSADVTGTYAAYGTKPVNGIAVSQALKKAKEYTDEKAVTVDQTYDAGSENAQSGVAVAKAVEDLKSDIYPQIIVNKGMIYTYSELIQSFPSNRISSIQFHTRGYAFSGSVTNIDLPSSGYVAFRIYDASSSICCIDVHRGELYKVDYIEHWNSSHSEVTYEVSVYCKTKELDSKLTTLENSLGDIDTALDNIIALQNSYIGGATE